MKIQESLNPLRPLAGPPSDGHTSQRVPSPTGAYTALVVEHPEDARMHSRVLKVIRANNAPAEPPTPLHEVWLNGMGVPRLTWMCEDTLLVDEGEPAPPRTLQGEVVLVFSPWQARLSPPTREPRPDSRLSYRPPVGIRLPVEARLPLETRPPVEARPPVESAYRIPGLSLSTDFAVLAGGGHAGRKSEMAIDQSGHPATTMSVSVDHPSKPVVLMIAAHEPTIWSIQCAAGTKLLAVLASGFHRQVVTGLDADIPVAIHTYDNKSPCGSFSVDEHRLDEVNRASLRFFERQVDKVYPAHEGIILMGESPHSRSQWVGRGNAPVETYLVEPVVRPDPAEELDAAVRKGLLRRANVTDRQQWEEAMESLLARGGMRPRSSRRASRHDISRAYVVLKPMKLPDGLYGARSAIFFVPRGTERPHGNPGHSTIYDFNDMSSNDAFGE